jgi:transcriptional repressor NrdR
MKCPYCESDDTRVIDTAHETTGPGIRRRRECNQCSRRFSTLERAILDTPMVVKSDGRREPFDRAKLLSSIRMACAKRPIASASLDGLVNQIEARIQQTGKAEVPTRMIGDLRWRTSASRPFIWASMIWRVCGAKSTKFSNGSSAPVLIEVSPIPRLCAGVVFLISKAESDRAGFDRDGRADDHSLLDGGRPCWK